MKKLLFLFLLVPSLVFALPGITPKKAMWDANVETDVAGYKLYWSDDTGVFTEADMVDVGNVLEYPLDGIDGTLVTITAYDTAGNESDFAVPVPLDNSPPVVPSTLQIVPQ